MSTSAPKSSSAQGVVLMNAYAQTAVVLAQLLAPKHLYGGHLSRSVSNWTGLPLVELVPENSPAHSIILAYGCAVLCLMWIAARSPHKADHATIALMQFIYATITLASCLALPFAPAFGSSIALISVVPNVVFPALICFKGEVGIKDFVALVSGGGAGGEGRNLKKGQ